MHILTLSGLFPNAMQPVHAVFIRNRMSNFTKRYGHRWTVVAPVPYYPPAPFPAFRSYDRLVAQVPSREDFHDYSVYHPRYPTIPKLGRRWYGKWMTWAVRKTILEVHRHEPIDIIDGHYVYPDGTAAVEIGRELGVPVLLSARGTDLNLYPSIRAVRPLIRRNLAYCSHLICVCSDLRTVALQLGMPEAKVSVVGNGVDTSLFRPGNRADARNRLGLPNDKILLLSVGHLTERKGFHLVIEAVARQPREDVVLAIVGAGPEQDALSALAGRLGIRQRVLMPGAVLNSNLPDWYRAADIFVLASSREGWPNVLCEAQATGLPIVATAVWGIPEIVSEPYLGLLVRERTTTALASAIESALTTSWDYRRIAAMGQSRSWEQVSDELQPLFENALRKR